MKHLDRAIRDGHIDLDKPNDQLIYQPQGKHRVLSNPEEQVQLGTYLKLIYEYDYPATHIRVCQDIQIGSSTREGDIVVYRDDRVLDPFIIIECKKEGITDSSFQKAIDQGFSYAAATEAEFVWATSGDRDAVFQVLEENILERDNNRLDRIPTFRESKRPGSVFRRRLGRWLNSPVTTDTMLFSGILVVVMAAFSGLTVYFHEDIREFLDPWWTRWKMNNNWLYTVIVASSTLFSMGIGLAFMRSHVLFGASILRRRFVYLMICVILFLPVWFAGQSMANFQWWTTTSYFSRKFPILLYLWPYLKGFPAQFFALYGFIWLARRQTPKS